MTREQQKAQRYHQILQVALGLFVQKGYAATQIIDIAKGANMSPGLLFHYFPSKEALYVALVEFGLQGTKIPLAGNHQSPLDFFTKFTQVLLTHIQGEPMLANMFVLMRQAQQGVAVPPAVRSIACRVDTIEQSVALIEAGQANGSFKPGDPRALANAYWWSIQGIMEQHVQNPTAPLPEPEWIIDILRNQNGGAR